MTLINDNLFNTLPFPVIITDKSGNIVKYNRESINHFNHYIDNKSGFFRSELFPKEYLERISFIKNNSTITIREFYIKLKVNESNIENRCYKISISLINSGNDDSVNYIFIYYDITEVKNLEKFSLLTAGKYREFIDDIPMIICELDLNLYFKFYNNFTKDFFNLPQLESFDISGNIEKSSKAKIIYFFSQDEKANAYNFFKSSIGKIEISRSIFSLSDFNNRCLKFEIIVVPIEENGLCTGLWCIANDVTEIIPEKEISFEDREEGIKKNIEERAQELYRANDQLQQEIEKRKIIENELRLYAATDVLTGIFNRRTGLLFLENRIKLSKRDETYFLICFVDVNNLKSINDKYGHNEGDELIICISQILKKSVRDSDIVFRLGGDEFIIIFHSASIDKSQLLWERIQYNIDEINSSAEKKYDVSVSYGFAEYNPNEEKSIDDLLSYADNEMYKKKEKYHKI